MAQIYGYIVCLVAVITFIICLANIIPSIIDLGDPLHAGVSYRNVNAPSLASFDNYKMDVLKSTQNEGQGASAYVPDDQTIKVMYEAAKNDKIQDALHDSRRSIMVDSIIIIVSVILFVTHWIWMRRLRKS